MSDAFLEVLLNRFGLFYGTVDRDLNVRFPDDKIFAYLSAGQDGECRGLAELFPEVVGVEDEILHVIDGGRREFSIQGINRSAREEIFYNLYFMHRQEDLQEAVVVVRDLTKEMIYRQSLQQNKNEIELLQHQLIEKNRILDLTNRELTESRDELRVLNRSLEENVRGRTLQLEESTKLAQRLFDQTVNALMYALEKRDPYTAGHQQRVSALACAIAREIDAGDALIEGIIVAGNVHDIGKIYVPSEFLTKPGRLTDEEFNVIKAHPRIGFEILRDIEFPWPVASIVLQHHERLDGSGYPYGLEGDEIRFESRILCVADVVEAMATMRPYRISPGLNLAFEEIVRNSGILYEKQVVDACVRLFRVKGFNWPS